jgi:DNA-binding transcriptional LysR family regulator
MVCSPGSRSETRREGNYRTNTAPMIRSAAPTSRIGLAECCGIPSTPKWSKASDPIIWPRTTRATTAVAPNRGTMRMATPTNTAPKKPPVHDAHDVRATVVPDGSDSPVATATDSITGLFERRGRAVALTRAGHILYEATREVMACLGRADDRLRELHGAATTLPLAATFTAGLYILPGRLAFFRTLHPEVRTTLEIFPAATVEARVLDQSFDVGLVGHEIRDNRLVATVFFSDDLVVAVPAGHRWASQTRGVRPEQLHEEPFIATAVGSGTRMVVEDRVGRNGTRLTEVLDFGNMEGVKKAVEAGLGVSVLSKSVIQREVSAGLLSMVRLVGRDMKRRFSLISRKGCILSETAQGFLTHLVSAGRQSCS